MIFETDSFQSRHIGPRPDDIASMLETIQASSLDALIDEAVPASIRLPGALNLPNGVPEHEHLRALRGTAARNEAFRSYLGLGYYDCVVPSVILRNVLENPSWYTPYTPYQAEIAQGRLEASLNFQTMVRDLTGMDLATASLLDEATAAAEAMTLLHRVHSRRDRGAHQFVVSSGCFPQTIDVLRGRAEPLGIELIVADVRHVG
jgi:glycine dehydrogenase